MRTTLGMILAMLSVCAPAQSHPGRPLIGGSVFQQLAEVTGTQAGADFGASVAISGTTVVVGAPLGTSGCNGQSNCGVAYVYTQANGTWSDLTLVATLTESNGTPFGAFGESVAISGGTIVISGFDATINQPAAYVFVNPSGSAIETAELTVSGAAVGSLSSVGIDGDTVVIGMPQASIGANIDQGTAYVYTMPAGGWTNMTQTGQLVATDGTSNFEFGTSLGVSGSNIVVGAPGASTGGVHGQGLAYLFVKRGAGWGGIRGQTTELEPSTGTRNGAFGDSVSVSGNAVAVGASSQTVNSHQSEGEAYVFSRPSGGWPNTMTETASLTASRGTSGERLGVSVATNGRIAMAGSPLARNRQGVAYLFIEPSGGWQDVSSVNEVTASDGAPDNLFGAPLALGDGVVVIGAPGWPAGGLSSDGAVYVFGGQGQ